MRKEEANAKMKVRLEIQREREGRVCKIEGYKIDRRRGDSEGEREKERE